MQSDITEAEQCSSGDIRWYSPCMQVTENALVIPLWKGPQKSIRGSLHWLGEFTLIRGGEFALIRGGEFAWIRGSLHWSGGLSLSLGLSREQNINRILCIWGTCELSSVSWLAQASAHSNNAHWLQSETLSYKTEWIDLGGWGTVNQRILGSKGDLVTNYDEVQLPYLPGVKTNVCTSDIALDVTAPGQCSDACPNVTRYWGRFPRRSKT